MTLTSRQNHTLGLIMLSMTALFWGAGFVLNDQLVQAAFYKTPALLNTIRFVVAAVCLLAVFNKRIRFNKSIALHGSIGGALLFGGFLLQLIGLKYTTPSHNGFFTTAYIVFVPIISMLVTKKRPPLTVAIGVLIALGGMVVLNIRAEETPGKTIWLGDLLTLLSALMFALQIIWTDTTLKKGKCDYVQMTFWQITFAAALYVVYTLAVESRFYQTINFDPKYCLWRLAIVTLCGTAFAYYAQTFAQKNLSPTETSLLMACESPIGAILSIAFAIETFAWQTVIGGVMVLIAVVLVEVLTPLLERRKAAKTTTQDSDA